MKIVKLIARFLRRLRSGAKVPIHPDVKRISGLVPPDVDARALHAAQYEVAERVMREDRNVLRKPAE